MASLSDVIERLIKEMMQESDGCVEINRNELAQRIHCVPSQITYVLTTRFTNGQGYEVVSRRGGGGSIRIRHVVEMKNGAAYIMHAINALEELSELSQHVAGITIQNCLGYEVISPEVAKIMSAALSDRALAEVDPGQRDSIRLGICKNMLLQVALLKEQEE